MGLEYDSPDPIALQGTYFSSGNVLFSMENAAVAGTISKITIKPYLRCYTPGGGSQNIYAKVKIGSTVYTPGNVSVSYATTPALHSLDIATNPKTGVAWTWEDIDDLLIGVYKQFLSGGWAYLYRFTATVTYNPGTYTPKSLAIGGVGISPGGMMI